MATLVIFANVFGLILFLRGRADRLLGAVVDPLHPDWSGMEQAFTGFTVYAMSLLGVLAIAALFATRYLAHRIRDRRGSSETPSRNRLPVVVLAGVVTASVVLVFIEVLLFQDYGIHFYEFDVFGILANAALRRDLGIQPAEVARVTAAGFVLLAAEVILALVAIRLASWRNGALARACGSALLVAIPGGMALFRAGERDISSDRAEFESVLPLGPQLLLRATSRPFIAVKPRLGPNGYPTLGPGDVAPTIARKKNIVFFVADGLRGDMVRPELTPNLLRFGQRSDVIRSRRHVSTGHVSEEGVFGLEYAIYAQAFNSFLEQRIPAFPLEVLKRNGYRTLFLASSRLSPYPSDQLTRGFDDVKFPANDDEAMAELRLFLDARRVDGVPYFVFAFMYTPHYPFTSAKQPFRKYPLVGPSARTNYMNDVLQADDYFRQTLDLIREDYQQGRTAFLATSDHGEEIRDHGIFGHARATFWNEKVLVPFFLGLPGATLRPESRQETLSSHVDVWPTLFDYLGLNIPRARYSDGFSLLKAVPPTRTAFVAGRFFPYVDRPSLIMDATNKYWFRAEGMDENGRLCFVLTRATDVEDRALSSAPASARTIPAFQELDSTFWRFIVPSRPVSRPCRAR